MAEGMTREEFGEWWDKYRASPEYKQEWQELVELALEPWPIWVELVKRGVLVQEGKE